MKLEQLTTNDYSSRTTQLKHEDKHKQTSK